jgi:hypothetical protein
VPRNYEAAAPREGSKVSEAKPQVRNAVGLTVCEVMKPRTLKEPSRRVVESSTAITLLRFFGSVQLIHSSRFTIFIACEVAAHILPMATSTRLLMILLMILSRGD